jgi:hypothetical protein
MDHFDETITAGKLVVVGMSSKDEVDDVFAKNNAKLRFYNVEALNEPIRITTRITTNVDGYIPQISLACEVL